MLCILILFVLLLGVSPSFCFADWYPVQLRDESNQYILNQSVDRDKVTAILSKAAFSHFDSNAFVYTNLLRYQNHRLEYNDETPVYINGPQVNPGGGTSYGSLYVKGMILSPCLYFTGSSLADTGDLYILLFLRSSVNERLNGGGWSNVVTVTNCDALVVRNVSFNDSLDAIDNYNFETVSPTSTSWVFPYLIYTDLVSTRFYTYLTVNAPQFVQSQSILYSPNIQNGGSFLQLSNHFSVAWLRSMTYSGVSSTPSFSFVSNSLINNVQVCIDFDYTQPCLGGMPYESQSSGDSTSFEYVSYDLEDFSFYNDFDRGGQMDWSEFYSRKNMRNPDDDSVGGNSSGDESNWDPAGLQTPTIPELPGQENLDPLFEEEIELPTQEGLESLYEDIGDTVTTALGQNAGYNLLTTLINPNGFNPNAQLPSFSAPLVVHVGDITPMSKKSRTSTGLEWDLGTLEIDLNFLREEPFWTIWQTVRSILTMSLFIMTFLAGYGMYEKALAWSA